MAPNDRIKVQMQLSASEGRPFKGVIDCGKYIVKENGVFTQKGLFRGWSATAMRDVPGMSGYYVAYEAIKRAWKPWGKDGKHTDLQNLTAGGLSGQVSCSVCVFRVCVFLVVLLTPSMCVCVHCMFFGFLFLC
jgi:solute carrier family 25 (mitochondrial carnitine/acylcarnitine transporter), member 20/29